MTVGSTVHINHAWFSTDAQLRAFHEAIENASGWEKLLGRYRLRPGVAYLHSYILPWSQMPVVLVAAGELDIDARKVTFTAIRLRIFGHVFCNIRTDLTFECPSSDITAIEFVDYSSPFDTQYDLRWTRIRANRPPPLDNFLLTVGTYKPSEMNRVREQSDALRHKLGELLLVD